MAFERVGFRAVIEGLNTFNRDAKVINQRLAEVTGNLAQVEQAGKKTGVGLQDISRELKVAGVALTAVGAAGTAFIFSSTKLAARVETLGVVTETLGRNVGKTRQEILDLEQAVKAQGITLQGSRKAIALMIQSSIDLAHATDLARLAQNAAVIANINSSDAFEHLVYTITSGNVRMARTLGLQVSFQTAYEATAKSLGKTTLELTEQEKVAARTQAVLAAGVNIVGAYEQAMTTAGKKVLSLDRHLEESSRIMGELFLPLYAEAVDVFTEFLEGIEDAGQAQQRGIAATVASASAIASLSGASLIFLSQLPRIIEGMQKLAGVSASAAGAIGFLIAALAALAVAASKARAENASLREQIYTLAQQITRDKGTYRDYENALLKAAEGTALWELAARQARGTGETQREAVLRLLQAQGLLTEKQFEAIRAAESFDRALLNQRAALSGSQDAASAAASGFEDMADAQAQAAQEAEALEKAQEMLKGQLDEVQLRISTDITPQFEDFREDVADLQQSLQDLEAERLEAIGALELGREEDIEKFRTRIQNLSTDLEVAKLRLQEMGEATSQASRIAAEARVDELTSQLSAARAELSALAGTSAEELANIESEYADKMSSARNELEETTKAWQRQTAEIVFNLATQRLGIGGFTEEEIAALTALAGPEGLGLIDEAGVALIERVDEINRAMEAAGDQSELAVQDMVKLAESMLDPTRAAEDLAEAIRGVESAITATNRMRLPLAIKRTAEARQMGGPALAGGSYLVGEAGPELFTPRSAGMIIPNKLLSAMSAMTQAVTSAIPIPGTLAPAMAAQGATTNQNFNMTVNTSAPREPIIADFNLLALQAGRR